MRHKPETAPLYRVLAEVMTQLEQAGEIGPERDHTNLNLVQWDRRKKRFMYRPEETGH